MCKRRLEEEKESDGGGCATVGGERVEDGFGRFSREKRAECGLFENEPQRGVEAGVGRNGEPESAKKRDQYERYGAHEIGEEEEPQHDLPGFVVVRRANHHLDALDVVPGTDVQRSYWIQPYVAWPP